MDWRGSQVDTHAEGRTTGVAAWAVENKERARREVRRGNMPRSGCNGMGRTGWDAMQCDATRREGMSGGKQ
jgi:hypothetical protein